LKKLLDVMERVPDGWVRLGLALPDGKALVLLFNVSRGKAGPIIQRCRVRCEGVHEYHLEALDGGGVRFYGSEHPLARQYSAPRARLRCGPVARGADVFAAVVGAHSRIFGDWVSPDRYLGNLADLPKRVTAEGLTVSGPDFVVRGYSRALRALGVTVGVRSFPRRRQPARIKVLHFSQSFVVAEKLRTDVLRESDE
jgi:hypothetical protein